MGDIVQGFITYPVQVASVAQYPSNASALTDTDEAVSSLPSRVTVAIELTKLAVLLLRGSAAAILLSPAAVAVFLLAR